MRKVMLLFFPLLNLSVLLAGEQECFKCDFSKGLAPSVSAAPVKAFNAGASIVASDNGKAIRVGKKANGSITRVAFRCQDTSAAEGLTPFPMKNGRLTFRFRPVDWKIGSNDFNMLILLSGPSKARLHVIYLTPKTTGKPSIQICYGVQGGKPSSPQKVTALFPYVALAKDREWHDVEVEWGEYSLNLTVDGESQLVDTAALELPDNFTADTLLLGAYGKQVLAGLTDITDIHIYGDDGK